MKILLDCEQFKTVQKPQKYITFKSMSIIMILHCQDNVCVRIFKNYSNQGNGLNKKITVSKKIVK